MNASSKQSEFEELTTLIREFAIKRKWEIFHNPKNLAMAVAGEAGELVAEFQWLTADESEAHSMSNQKREAVALEIADIQIYLLRLADVLNLSIPEAVRTKLDLNEKRF